MNFELVTFRSAWMLYYRRQPSLPPYSATHRSRFNEKRCEVSWMDCRAFSMNVSTGTQHIYVTFNHLKDPHISWTDENSTSAKLYLDINAFCEKCMKWTLILQDGIYIIPSLCALLLASVFYYYRDGHVEAASLKLPMKTRYCKVFSEITRMEHSIFRFGFVFCELERHSRRIPIRDSGLAASWTTCAESFSSR